MIESTQVDFAEAGGNAFPGQHEKGSTMSNPVPNDDLLQPLELVAGGRADEKPAPLNKEDEGFFLSRVAETFDAPRRLRLGLTRCSRWSR